MFGRVVVVGLVVMDLWVIYVAYSVAAVGGVDGLVVEVCLWWFGFSSGVLCLGLVVWRLLGFDLIV